MKAGRNGTRRRIAASIGAGLLALASVVSAGADASEQANCVATLTSHLGGVAQAVHFLRAAAEASGIPFGQFVEHVAHAHGTVEQCMVIASPPSP